MTVTNKDRILIIFTICCIAIPFFLSPIPQDPSYHNFADQRQILSIPNFYNVISNFPFFVIGVIGLYLAFKGETPSSLANITLFIGVTGIGLGSAWYHYNPSNTTLVWDRIPMSITFMSFFSIILGQYVNKRAGTIVLSPLLILGIVSILTWYLGELKGRGDLRLYALVQFYPMIAIPLLVILYPSPASVKIKIVTIIFLYGIAKICEALDSVIFGWGEIISGHSLKHLVAAASIAVILSMANRELKQTASLKS